MKKIKFIGVMMVLLMSFAAISFAASAVKEEAELRMEMRTLWEEHTTWTRNYIISELAGLSDLDKVTERLLRNQDDIGNLIKPYYGEDAGKKLATMLREHIKIATEVVKAAKLNRKDDINMAQKKWNLNAEEIAIFLSKTNPNWSKDTLTDMMETHMELTTEEITSRIEKDWSDDINAYNKIHTHILKFADVLTDGIVKQFPSRFGKQVGSSK